MEPLRDCRLVKLIRALSLSLSSCLFLSLAPNCKYIHLKISARNITQKRTKIFHNMQSKQSEESESDKESERERVLFTYA